MPRALVSAIVVATLSAATVDAQTIVTGSVDSQVQYSDGVRSILVSQIGYAIPGVRVAYLHAPTRADGDTISGFTVEDDLGNPIVSGVPEYVGPWVTAHYWRLDLTSLTTAGTYRVRAGGLTSHLFPVTSPRALYFDPLYAGMMLDQLRVRVRYDALGGFIDAGNDIRETNSHATQVIGMLDLLDRYGVRLNVAELLEIDDFVRHFATFILDQQDPSGRFLGGWFGGNLITDGQWPNHLRGVYALVRLGRHYRGVDPTLTAQIDAAVTLAMSYSRTTMDVATTHSVFLIDRLLSDASHHLETDDATSLADARSIAAELRSRQILRADVAPGDRYGAFREQRGSGSLARLNHHAFGTMTGAYWGLPLWPLGDLVRRYPSDPDAVIWRATIDDFVRGDLLPMASQSPFALVANGDYSGVRWFSDLFHGMSMTYAIAATALVRYGELLAARHLYDVAEKQLLWIGGLNTGAGFPDGPESFSCIVGHGYQWLRDGHGVLPDVPGSIVNGLSATPQFVQQLPVGPEQPRYLCDESWISHTGGFLMAVSELLRARLDPGNTLRIVRLGGDLEYSIDAVTSAQTYGVYSGDPRTSFPTLVATGSSSTLSAPTPPGILVAFRMSASDDATEGPR